MGIEAERNDLQQPVLRRQLEAALRRQNIIGQGAVFQQHGFGPARGSGGVNDASQIAKGGRAIEIAGLRTAIAPSAVEANGFAAERRQAILKRRRSQQDCWSGVFEHQRQPLARQRRIER